MKTNIRFFPILLLATVLLAGCGRSVWQSVGPRVGPLRDDREKFSYAIGVTLGQQWKNSKTDIDPKSAAKGMTEGFGGSVSMDKAKALTKQLSNYQKFKVSAMNDRSDQPPAAPPSDLPSRDVISYALGVNLGMAWRSLHMDIDPGSVDRGLNDFFSGQDLQLSIDDAKNIVSVYGQKFAAAQAEARRKLSENNKAQAKAFFAANKTKDGVVTNPSGLQYKVLAPGSGQSPEYDSWVAVRYRGRLLDGTDVDDSTRIGDPYYVSPRTVNGGISEALQEMKPGAKWELYVPSDLAYGEEGGVGVGPNAALIYDIELISILPGRPQPTAAQVEEMNKN